MIVVFVAEMTGHHTIKWGEGFVGIKDNCSDATKENRISQEARQDACRASGMEKKCVLDVVGEEHDIENDGHVAAVGIW